MDEYARFARFYDPVVGPPLRSLHQAMVRELRIRECGSVIDLCCGTGLFLSLAHRIGLKATGVDLSPDMLAVARAKHPDIHLVEKDASAVPLPDDSFDSATISFGLHEKPLPTAQAILHEAMRLVRSGGVVLIADYRLPEPNASTVTGWAIRLVERLAGRNHYDCFKAYMAGGGSAGFLRDAGVDFELKRIALSGWAGLFVVFPG